MTIATTRLDAELVERFRRDGFVVVPDLLTDDELDRYGAAVTAAVQRAHRRRRPAARREEPLRAVVHPVHEPVGGLPRRPAAHLPPAHRRRPPPSCSASTPSGCGTTRRCTSWPAAARPTPTRTMPYWPIKETGSITAWIPFDGATPAVGLAGLPARLPPGRAAQVRQHLLRRARGHPVRPRGRRHRARLRRGAAAARCRSTTASPCTSPTPTRTDRDRAVHTIIYFADGSTRGYPHPHFAVDRAGIEVGQPIDSDVTPIAWPRPAGDLPPPPTSWIELPAASRTRARCRSDAVTQTADPGRGAGRRTGAELLRAAGRAVPARRVRRDLAGRHRRRSGSHQGRGLLELREQGGAVPRPAAEPRVDGGDLCRRRQVDDIAGGSRRGAGAAVRPPRRAGAPEPSATWRCSSRPTRSRCAAIGRASSSPATRGRSPSSSAPASRELFDAPDADPLTLGLIAQSLYAGLLMHGAFLDEIDTTCSRPPTSSSPQQPGSPAR